MSNAMSGRQPTNQIESYPLGHPGSIPKLYKHSANVDTKMFNEITLKVGDKNTNYAFEFNAKKAYVIDAIERINRKGKVETVLLRGFDIGIVLSVYQLVPNSRCKCWRAGPIALPVSYRYHILLCLHLHYLLIDYHFMTSQ